MTSVLVVSTIGLRIIPPFESFPMGSGIARDSVHADAARGLRETTVNVWSGPSVQERLPVWEAWYNEQEFQSLSRHPRWMEVFRKALGHSPYCIEQTEAGRTTAMVPLALMKSWLFGRFLVSLPYLNLGGVIAEPGKDASGLVSRAIDLADELNVRHLELRHEVELPNERINHRFDMKVHMRLELPRTLSELWDSFRPKVRNQIRKGTKSGVTTHWGSHDLLGEFYSVFSQNMRDLGTPVFAKRLFETILHEFPESSELCVARIEDKPVAAALLIHGNGVTEVPSASSIRRYNSTCANMTMYWHLISRAVEKKQHQFDFGRSTVDSSTFTFKKQWGALPHPALWQFYVRKGSVHSMRPECGRYSAAIRVWRKLPVVLTNALGPSIIRGVP